MLNKVVGAVILMSGLTLACDAEDIDQPVESWNDAVEFARFAEPGDELAEALLDTYWTPSADAASTGSTLDSLTTSSSDAWWPGFWRNWDDRDNPSGTGDWEIASLHADPCQPGEVILGFECRTVGTHIPAASTGEDVSCFFDGLVCRRSDQPDNQCFDYEVRFRCCQQADPAAVCGPWDCNGYADDGCGGVVFCGPC